MARQKLDRWERIVLKALKRQDTPGDPAVWLNGPDVVKLLREEHEAVVRMIRTNPLFGATANDWKQGYTQACQDLLSTLNERAK